MNISSTSATSSLWSLLASQAASKTSSASGKSGGEASFSLNEATTADATAPAASDRPPPPPPGQFDVAGSTMQFAQSMGAPPEDPIQSLDTDGDGAVSADEFGLDSASSDVQRLFSAIDGDGDGSLSTDEIDGFREQMMSAQEGSPSGPPPTSGSGGASDSSSDSSGAGSGGAPDIQAFLQQIASRYLAMATSEGTASQGSSVAVTA